MYYVIRDYGDQTLQLLFWYQRWYLLEVFAKRAESHCWPAQSTHDSVRLKLTTGLRALNVAQLHS